MPESILAILSDAEELLRSARRWPRLSETEQWSNEADETIDSISRLKDDRHRCDRIEHADDGGQS